MKLTVNQIKQMRNQHIGTGYLILRIDAVNVQVIDITRGRDGEWYAGLKGAPLFHYLTELSKLLPDY